MFSGQFPSRSRAFYSKNTFIRHDFTLSIRYRASSCLPDRLVTHDYKTYVYEDLNHNRRFYRGANRLEITVILCFFVGLTAVFRFEHNLETTSVTGNFTNTFFYWWKTYFLNCFFPFYRNVPELWRPSVLRKNTSKVACITAIDGYMDSCWIGIQKIRKLRIPGFRIFLIHITAVKSGLIVSKYDRKTIFIIRVDLVSFCSCWMRISAIVESYNSDRQIRLGRKNESLCTHRFGRFGSDVLLSKPLAFSKQKKNDNDGCVVRKISCVDGNEKILVFVQMLVFNNDKFRSCHAYNRFQLNFHPCKSRSSNYQGFFLFYRF